MTALGPFRVCKFIGVFRVFIGLFYGFIGF